MPVLCELPEMACRDAKGLRRFAGPQGKGGGNFSWNHDRCSSGSLAAQRGLHTQNPPMATISGNFAEVQ
jgi:hypothetical protein